MLKRIVDIAGSAIGLILLSPVLIIIALLVKLDSKGPVFFMQTRIGKNLKEFRLFKFRTMTTGSESKGQLTVGAKDNRITKVGYNLRKYKLDELPQLLNVLIGEMSLVGPRPEVPKYVNLYNAEQKKVLNVKPGITDYASIEYSNENELLAKAENPEQFYIDQIMPAKLDLNLKYIREKSFITDLKIIWMTVVKVFVR